MSFQQLTQQVGNLAGLPITDMSTVSAGDTKGISITVNNKIGIVTERHFSDFGAQSQDGKVFPADWKISDRGFVHPVVTSGGKATDMFK